MSVANTTRTGTVSSDISGLASALLANQRIPLTALKTRLSDLNKRSSVLGTLKTRLLALHDEAQVLARTGTLSPFAAKAASVSDATVLSASAGTSAASGTVSLTVSQLARRATHVSDVLTDTGTTISGGGTGTFNFTVTIAGTAYNASVTINGGDTDKTILDNVAAAITTAVGSNGSAVRVQPATGQSRLSISSANTGTANKISFTDTDGLLARLGVVHGAPTAATDTTGGYVYDDLGGHELDAKMIVDGLTYYRNSNTVTDLLGGVTLTLKSTSASAVTLKVQPDADGAVNEMKTFISKYNDAIDYLKQQTFIDAKAGTRGPLAGDSTYLLLANQIRTTEAAIVQSQGAGTPNTLAALGITAGDDGKLAITDEAKLRDTFTTNPGAVQSLFNASDGVGNRLMSFVDRYSSFSGFIVGSQSAVTSQIDFVNDRISRLQASLDKKQAALEQQLARQQATLNALAQQQSQIVNFINRTA
jgi:flagellar hook-associated protein 2